MNYQPYDKNEAFDFGGPTTVTESGDSFHPLAFEIATFPSMNQDDWGLLDEDFGANFAVDDDDMDSFLPGLYEDEADSEERQGPPAPPTVVSSSPDQEMVSTIPVMCGSSEETASPESLFQQKHQPKSPCQIELELEYQRSLKKLANSMRRSDNSRSIVKRQRSSEAKENFFQSPRCEELERSRQQMLHLFLGGGGV